MLMYESSESVPKNESELKGRNKRNFSVPFVGLSVHQQDYWKTTGLIFMKLGGRVQHGPIKFWSRSRSQGRYMNYFWLSQNA